MDMQAELEKLAEFLKVKGDRLHERSQAKNVDWEEIATDSLENLEWVEVYINDLLYRNCWSKNNSVNV